MGGGLLQLSVEGAQGLYLTNNPEITFFKIGYRRHTNFSIEAIQQDFNAPVDFGKRISCKIARCGDMIHRMYLQTQLPSLDNYNNPVPPLTGKFKWAHNVGLALVKSIDLEIGGQYIDRHYGEWLYIWNELSITAGKRDGYQKMTGYLLPPRDDTHVTYTRIPPTNLFIPLEFWFCRNPGLALPLIALQYHEVTIHLELRKLSELNREGFDPIPEGKSLGPTNLWVDYVFLDSEERRRFAQLPHEYLIEQLQYSGPVKSTTDFATVNLNFNHYVKELVWVSQYEEFSNVNQWFNFTDTYTLFHDSARTVIRSAKLQINGSDRFTARPGEYFNLVQPYQHHTNVPTTPGINVYSFAINPENNQPSGSMNFSRLQSATINLEFNILGNPSIPIIQDEPPRPDSYTVITRVYAFNYNVLRIASGMAGLAYST